MLALTFYDPTHYLLELIIIIVKLTLAYIVY